VIVDLLFQIKHKAQEEDGGKLIAKCLSILREASIIQLELVDGIAPDTPFLHVLLEFMKVEKLTGSVISLAEEILAVRNKPLALRDLPFHKGVCVCVCVQVCAGVVHHMLILALL
jgi:hypothetical protein